MLVLQTGPQSFDWTSEMGEGPVSSLQSRVVTLCTAVLIFVIPDYAPKGHLCVCVCVCVFV
jgi:hypothetical protein